MCCRNRTAVIVCHVIDIQYVIRHMLRIIFCCQSLMLGLSISLRLYKMLQYSRMKQIQHCWSPAQCTLCMLGPAWGAGVFLDQHMLSFGCWYAPTKTTKKLAYVLHIIVCSLLNKDQDKFPNYFYKLFNLKKCMLQVMFTGTKQSHQCKTNFFLWSQFTESKVTMKPC